MKKKPSEKYPARYTTAHKTTCTVKTVLTSLITGGLLLLPAAGQALEIKITDSQISAATVQNTGEPFETLNEVIAPASVTSYILHNRQTGQINISLAAKKRSKVRLEWDNPNELFPVSNVEEIIFDYPGKEVTLRFNATSPVSGAFKIYNMAGQLLSHIPYQIKKESPFRQTLRGTANRSQNVTDTNTLSVLEDTAGDISFGYSISKKVSHSADPYWSVSTNINLDQENTDDYNVNATFSYTW